MGELPSASGYPNSWMVDDGFSVFHGKSHLETDDKSGTPMTSETPNISLKKWSLGEKNGSVMGYNMIYLEYNRWIPSQES